MSGYHENSIFWVETNKIQPNPFQPRREFEPRALEDLADSVRQYGILQPLVVTRKEVLRPDGNGMDVLYELIAGERRLRASKIAGLQQVPVIIRKETNNKVKLELAIIENLQREDLNPIDRALAFEQLYKEFNLTHVEIGKRMGKSRVYVSNTLRLLSLPEEIKQGLMAGRISEGHTRPLLMLTDRPEEQGTLYKEIMVKKMSVRDAEKVARKIAQDKVRKKQFVVDPVIRDFEKKLAENLGTRVHIEPKEKGGQITIDYFTIKDLESILSSMQKVEREQSMMESFLTGQRKTAAKEKITETTGVSFSTPDVAESQLESPVTPEPTHNLPEVHHQELPAYKHIPNSDLIVSDKVLESVHSEIKKPTPAPIESIKKQVTEEISTQPIVENPVVDKPQNSLENMLDNLESNLISEKPTPAREEITQSADSLDKTLTETSADIFKPETDNVASSINFEPQSSLTTFHDDVENKVDHIEETLVQNNFVQESKEIPEQNIVSNHSIPQQQEIYQAPVESEPVSQEEYSAPANYAPPAQQYSAPVAPNIDPNQQQYQAQNSGQYVQAQRQQQYVPQNQNQVHYQQAPTRKKSLFKRIFG